MHKWFPVKKVNIHGHASSTGMSLLEIESIHDEYLKPQNKNSINPLINRLIILLIFYCKSEFIWMGRQPKEIYNLRFRKSSKRSKNKQDD